MAAPPSVAASMAGAASSTVVGGIEAHEQAKARIRQVYQRFAVAWSNGDAAGVGSLLAQECDHQALSHDRHVKRGRTELLDRWTQAFARRGAVFSVQMSPTLHSIRLLGRDLALVDGDLNYSAGIGAAGTTRRRCSQPFTAVMTQSDEEWLIVSIRVGAAIPMGQNINSAA